MGFSVAHGIPFSTFQYKIIEIIKILSQFQAFIEEPNPGR